MKIDLGSDEWRRWDRPLNARARTHGRERQRQVATSKPYLIISCWNETKRVQLCFHSPYSSSYYTRSLALCLSPLEQIIGILKCFFDSSCFLLWREDDDVEEKGSIDAYHCTTYLYISSSSLALVYSSLLFAGSRKNSFSPLLLPARARRRIPPTRVRLELSA